MDYGAAAEDDRSVIEWHGRGGELFRIFFAALVLSILTLGVYRFWGKTRIRRYLWSHTSFEGERLEYTGTGKELFLGFLIVMFVVLLPLFGGMTVLRFHPEANSPELLPEFDFLQAMIVLYLIPVAIYRARRYRLSRTRWRGVRAAQDGSALAYGGITFGCYYLAALTLGLTLPVIRTLLVRYKLGNTMFGNLRLHFTARPGPLYKHFLAVIGIYIGIFILIIMIIGFTGEVWSGGADLASSGGRGFTTAQFAVAQDEEMPAGPWQIAIILLILLGFIFLRIPWYFFQAAEYRYFAGQTRYGDLRFAADVTGWRLAGLNVGNLLILLFTLGLGRPLVHIRTIRFLSRHFRMSGAQDFSAIIQSALEAPATGEGLADALDVGGF